VTTFGAIFVPMALRTATSDEAWLEAMLDAERALATAEAGAGVIPKKAAKAVAEACRPELYDVGVLAEEARAPGNPVEPLVRWVRESVGGDAADYVHWGATSQDVLDTAAMLVARRACDLVLGELEEVAAAAAELAETHARTPMVARTLLQQAAPTTFGRKAAGWLFAVLDARAALVRVRDERLAVQLGGAVGTLAPLGEHGLDVLDAFAEELGLARPGLPWHTDRTRIAELASALELVASSMAKIALDVALLSQTEVAEVSESDGGVSSTLPNKRNPIRSTRCLACARLVAAAATLLRDGRHEHERALADWHAEWGPLSDALACTGGAVWAAHELLEDLEVDADRMQRNLEATNGLVLAERISFLLAQTLGRRAANALVSEAAARAVETGGSLRDALERDARVRLRPTELDRAFDLSGYLGSAPALVERALARYHAELEPARSGA
jgi:3-carboxy-cis,cis-muconate cycloisomerase